MDSYEELCEEAFDLGIDIKQSEIPVPGLHAVYATICGACYIFMDACGTTCQKSCWLAEELGHHYTAPGRVLHYNCVDDWKAEARARRWAHARLLTPDAIRTAARNTDDIYEIAEALDVTVEFLRESICDFESKGVWLTDRASCY